MSTFLDKNKKKSALAALLLFLREHKSLSVLLLSVVLASFLFISPAYVLLHLPGGTRVAAGAAWLAGRFGVDISSWGKADGKRQFSNFLAALRAAKAGFGKAGGSFARGGAAGAGAGAGSGSLGFVKGSRKDLEAAGDDGAKPGPLTPVEPGAIDPWAFSEEDMYGERPGLVRSAFAGGFADVSNLSGGAFASKGFFGGPGPSAASVKLSDRVKGGLEGLGKPQTAAGAQIQGAAKGRLSASKAVAINKRMSRGMVGTHVINGQRAFAQLAIGRGRAGISVAPNCTPGSGCPGEFAATQTGAIYDGNALSGDRTDILTVPEIDGTQAPNMPDSGIADGYIRDAEKMEADAKKCREADDLYGPQETEMSKKQEALSNQFEALGCGQGMSCSKKNKGKIEQCKRWGDQMTQHCVDSMNVRCAHLRACPLTAGNTCSSSECGSKKSGNDYIRRSEGCMDVLAEGETCRPGREISSETKD